MSGPIRADVLDEALMDPAVAFATPDEVLRDARFSLSQKIEILTRWAYDCAELSVAEEEGMGGGESTDMSAVLKALDRISNVDMRHTAPTKQAGYRTAQPKSKH